MRKRRSIDAVVVIIVLVEVLIDTKVELEQLTRWLAL